MLAPPHSLRIVFTLSAFLTALVSVIAALPRTAREERPLMAAAVVAAAITAVVCLVALRGGRLLLSNVALRHLATAFGKALLLTYIKLTLVVGLVFVASLAAVGLPAKEVLLFAIFVAVWFPLWLAPSVAAFSTWRNLKSEAGDG